MDIWQQLVLLHHDVSYQKQPGRLSRTAYFILLASLTTYQSHSGELQRNK